MTNMLNKIASSSSGNCYIYNQDLMVDIGVPFVKIKPYIHNIKLLCLTHWHIDHFNSKTICKLLYEKPNIKIICGNWMVQLLVNLGINKKNIYVLNVNKKYDLGKYIIELVPAVHDIENCGYKIIIKKNNYKIFHITDTATLNGIEAKNFDLYCIEKNYDEEEIDRRIEEKTLNGEFVYETRVKNSHLSNEETNKFLEEMMGDNSKFIYCHQHIEEE